MVVFEDRTATGVLRWLTPGFRHCFCLVEEAEGWILLDPLKSSIYLDVIRGISLADLVQHFAGTGRTVLLGRTIPGPSFRHASLRPTTCVELVKRMLGLNAPYVWTPRQLFFLLTGKSGPCRFEVLAHPNAIDSVM